MAIASAEITSALTLPAIAPLSTATPEQDWRSDALCTQIDGDMFFPKSGDAGQAQRAKAICARCPVREQCLAAALEADERFGIFGGLTVRQRDALIRERNTPQHRRRHRAPCGTEAGAKRHWRDGEQPCEACRKAANRRRYERDANRQARRTAAVITIPRAANT